MKDNRLWEVFSKFIRMRDAAPFTGMVRCFTCGRVDHWTKMDCGHGIPRQHQATKYHEKNNHAQCKKCNGFEGGQQAIYKEEVEKRYGAGTWDKMMILSRTVCKRGAYEINVLLEYYKKEVEKLKFIKKI